MFKVSLEELNSGKKRVGVVCTVMNLSAWVRNLAVLAVETHISE